MVVVKTSRLCTVVSYGTKAVKNFVYWSFRYRNGFRGHMKSVVQDLLRRYLNVETQFQHGAFDSAVW